jgi:hypothetical protein
MDQAGIRSSYAIALLWVTAFVALAVSVNLVTELVFIDFVHGNPNRSQGNALTMMALFPPIFSIIFIIGVWLVFGPSQLLQASVTYLLVPKYGRLAFLFVALMLPISGVVTWYCFDYLTPSNINPAINEGPDWTPYQHGISPLRFLAATGIQAVVTTFTLAYCRTRYRRPLRKQLLLAALFVTILGGIAWGYRSTKFQYQFLDRPNITSPDTR